MVKVLNNIKDLDEVTDQSIDLKKIHSFAV